MLFLHKRKIISMDELVKEYSLSKNSRLIKETRDQQIKDVLCSKSDKFLLIIGPCSADNEEAVCDYVSRLARVQERVADKIIIVPRVFTNKPRTTGIGYKGIAHQPDLEKEPDLEQGILAMRKIHFRIISESDLPAADEILYPEKLPYVEDLLAYTVVGARSSESQLYRLIVSGLDCPTGMKNPVSGNLTTMLNSCIAAQSGHIFLFNGQEVESSGNHLTHCILRGGLKNSGEYFPNYHYEDLIELANLYKESRLINPAVIIDVSHANSAKNYTEQPRIAKEILHNRSLNTDLADLIKGVMIESYIEPGRQNPEQKIYGKSITDACLGWEESEKLIYTIAESL